MLSLFQLSIYFATIGFIFTLIFNILLITITQFKIKAIVGTYKQMVIIFALFGLIFSFWKLVSQPFCHNYNRALVVFSINEWLSDFKGFLQFSLTLYSGFYAIVLSFLAVQFVFRFLAIVNPKLTKKVEGIGILGWLMYPMISGASYTFSLYYFAAPDDYSDSYVRNEFLEVYSMDVTDFGHLNLIPYAADDSLRWNNILFLVISVGVIELQYSIIIYCGVRMHYAMKNKMGHLSTPNRKLHQQFFQALVVQTLVPTFLFVLPACPLLTAPLLDLKWSMQSGGVMALLGVYPPVDSIVFMLIVTEYRKALRLFCGSQNLVSQKITSILI